MTDPEVLKCQNPDCHFKKEVEDLEHRNENLSKWLQEHIYHQHDGVGELLMHYMDLYYKTFKRCEKLEREIIQDIQK